MASVVFLLIQSDIHLKFRAINKSLIYVLQQIEEVY